MNLFLIGIENKKGRYLMVEYLPATKKLKLELLIYVLQFDAHIPFNVFSFRSKDSVYGFLIL